MKFLSAIFKSKSRPKGAGLETQIFGQLDRHLSDRQWLEFDRPTIADIAVFPYVFLAPDGQIDLSSYSHVLAWIYRVKQLPGFIAMN